MFAVLFQSVLTRMPDPAKSPAPCEQPVRTARVMVWNVCGVAVQNDALTQMPI